MAKFNINPAFFPALRIVARDDGYVVLDAQTLRERFGVGKNGSCVSPDMQKEIRARGYEVRPVFKVETQRDFVVIYQTGAQPENLEAILAAVATLHSLSANRRLEPTTRNAEELAAKGLVFEALARFDRVYRELEGPA